MYEHFPHQSGISIQVLTKLYLAIIPLLISNGLCHVNFCLIYTLSPLLKLAIIIGYSKKNIYLEIVGCISVFTLLLLRSYWKSTHLTMLASFWGGHLERFDHPLSCEPHFLKLKKNITQKVLSIDSELPA